MFEIPLTLMGYGDLDDIAAAYALTYMSPKTFLNLGMFAANVPLRRWPKRFTQGYGRMFERLAAEVDVLTGVKIEKITRNGQIRVAVSAAGAAARARTPLSARRRPSTTWSSPARNCRRCWSSSI